MPTNGSIVAKQETLYFAYGSNFSLKQMGERCPQSKYVGIGRLHKYKWQINNRGYANIIPGGSTDVVYGLCYVLSTTDEAILDKKEGVRLRAYDKHYLTVEFFKANKKLLGQKTIELVKGSLGSTRAIESCDQGENRSQTLVYISAIHVENGAPKTEYVQRMATGITDALELGVSRQYIDRSLRPPLGLSNPSSSTPKSSAIKVYNGSQCIPVANGETVRIWLPSSGYVLPTVYLRVDGDIEILMDRSTTTDHELGSAEININAFWQRLLKSHGIELRKSYVYARLDRT